MTIAIQQHPKLILPRPSSRYSSNLRLHPPPLLWMLIRDRKWIQVEQRIKSHPKEVLYQCEQNGYTCLHLATIRHASFRIINALLTFFPEAVSVQDVQGNTPLHVAALHYNFDDLHHEFSPTNVVKRLLECDRENQYRALTTENSMRRTPLEYTCAMNSKYYLRKEIQQILLGGDGNDVPISSSFHTFWIICQMLLQAHSEFDSMQCRKITKQATCDFHIVHACANIPQCPSVLLQLATHFHPDQVTLRDHHGNLPLHAAIVKGSQMQENGIVQIGRYVENIKILFEAFPGAASVPHIDGRLPLHLLLDQGSQHLRIPCSEEAMMRLVAAYPAAATMKDVKSGHYPFMMASLSMEEDGENTDDVHMYCSVNLIYCLLRICPEFERFLF